MKKLMAGGRLKEWRELVTRYLAECNAVKVVPTLEGFNAWQKLN